MVLEASLRYAASCSVVVMDEVVDLNERVDVEMREVEEDVRTLKGEVIKSYQVLTPLMIILSPSHTRGSGFEIRPIVKLID